MTRCTECGGILTVVDDHRTHPACDPTDPDAARIRDRHAAYLAGLEGQALAVNAHTDHAAAALEMIRRTALVRRELNADDVRERFPAWDELHNKTRAASFGTAAGKANRYIAATGLMDRSTFGPTKGHHILRWRSLIFVDEFRVGLLSPVTRDKAAS